MEEEFSLSQSSHGLPMMAQIVAVAQQESFRLRVVELFVALETAGVVFAACLQEEA